MYLPHKRHYTYGPGSIPLTKQVVLFNGPPRSGKDAMISHLTPYLKFRHMKFAAPIKAMAAALLGIDQRGIETYKDEKHRLLTHPQQFVETPFGIKTAAPEQDTIRQLLIALSEDFLKVRYGDDFFGRVAVYEAGHSFDNMLLFSDCGFEPEITRFVRNMGPPNCILVRMHRTGCTFDGDSRSYLHGVGCEEIDVHNDDTLHNVGMRTLRAITKKWPNVEMLREPDWVKVL